MAGPSGRFMLNFLRSCQTVFKVVIPFHILISNVWSLSTSISLARLSMVRLFNFSHSNGCVMVSYCFIWIYLMIMMLSIFAICLFSIYISSLLKCKFRSYIHFLKSNGLFVCLLLGLVFFIYAGYKFLVRIFPLILWLSFHSLNSGTQIAEVVNLM